MQTRLKFKFAAAALVASLAFSLLHTTAVIADDETPPPVETPVETPPVEELSEDPVQNSETIAPLLEQVPPQTEVVVVVEGEIQPLATQ
ncbi:MAG: hypothetical protein LDL51_08855, partial [Chloroflexi bacterium]|nr:hypothetical protein [Chloroflexota bacterium]